MKTMKIWLLFLAVMMVAISAHARKNNDPEMRHVRLTMMDGKQVEGYIPKKYMTWMLEYQVRLSENPNAKKPRSMMLRRWPRWSARTHRGASRRRGVGACPNHSSQFDSSSQRGPSYGTPLPWQECISL